MFKKLKLTVLLILLISSVSYGLSLKKDACCSIGATFNITSASANQRIIFDGSDWVNDYPNFLTASDGNPGSSALFVTANGKIGIGITSSILTSLHIRDTNAGIVLEDTAGSYLRMLDLASDQANINKYTASGAPRLLIDAIAADGSSNSSIELFRELDTTGTKKLEIYNGQGLASSVIAVEIDAGTGIIDVSGNYEIGGARVLAIDPTDRSQTFVGYQAGLNTEINGGAYRNTAVGHQSLLTNTTGDYNTGVGYYSLYTSNGTQNTALGAYALWQSTGGYNTGIGGYVGYNQSGGDYNVFLGSYAGNGGSGPTLNSKSNNVMIGYAAGQNTLTGDGNIFLGYNAGYNETGSNKLYIENSDSASPLIEGDFSADAVTINGTFQSVGNAIIGNGSAGVDYTLTFDGEDNDGVITWQEDEDTFDMSCNLSLNSGPTINEISTDGTLAGDSDLAIPTEKAIKTYVDAVAANGYWDRTGTTLEPSTADDNLDMGTGNITTEGEVVCDALTMTSSTPILTFDDDDDDSFSIATKGSDDLHFYSNEAGNNATYKFFTASGDGTDYIALQMYAVGTSAATSPSEILKIDYNNNLFSIHTTAGGGGTDRDIEIEAGGNSNQIRLDADGNVGIGLVPTVNLHIDGTVANVPDDTQTLVTANSVTVDNVYIKVEGSTPGTDLSSNPQIAAGTVDGQVIELRGQSDTNTLILDDGNGLKTAAGASITLGLDDVIAFRWNGTLWCESYRGNL